MIYNFIIGYLHSRGKNMSIIITVLATLVALEFIYIMYLETFRTTSDKTSATFNMDKNELNRPSVNVLFKNQGVYNGLIAVLIFIAVYVFHDQIWTAILMGYIILVAIYGSITSNPKILLKQGGLAIITLIACILL